MVFFKDSNREKEKNSQTLKQVSTVKLNYEAQIQQIRQNLELLNDKETRLNQVFSKLSIFIK